MPRRDTDKDALLFLLPVVPVVIEPDNAAPAPSFSKAPAMQRILHFAFLTALSAVSVQFAVAEDKSDPPEGHSQHGEIFNEGPRQAAYLMDGVGNVAFDVTTSSDEARAFIVQGVAQLHGFWYFESERSFRQAAMLDPDCAMAYWGMAMSNRSNADRAKGFIAEADKRKKGTSDREQQYIKAFHKFINAKNGSREEKRERAEAYVIALDELLVDYPDDLEAKAFLCEFLWSSKRDGVKLPGYSATNAMIGEILEANPLHPAHHYRIHLWDSKKAENALESAARCGLSAPAIAHMWHMPGHIYSRLKRYPDAVYQQEASARVDHAHMMKDLVLPDQIHNFAHNNEWCIRNLIHIGRVNDAIELARNMIELPRHPTYNHIGKRGSHKYGRQRLMSVLRTYQLHEQLAAYAESPYLNLCEDETEDLARNRAVACAYAALGETEKAGELRGQIQQLLDAELKEQEQAKKKAGDEARKDKKKDKEITKAENAAANKFNSRIRSLRNALNEIDGRIAVHEKKWDEALKLLKDAQDAPVEERVAVMVQAGKTDEAVEAINKHVNSKKNEVRPLAAQVETLWAAGQKDKAKQAFGKLRKISSTIDIHVPVFARLEPIAVELGWPKDWRESAVVTADIGARPPLDALGPFRWQPVAAPDWTLPNIQNTPVSLASYRGRPVVVIFYLGAGCLHCAEQLQKFAPETEKFRSAGLELVAVSTDEQVTLSRANDDLDEPIPFPLVSDAAMDVFRLYRCYDDFEKQPLHGTFLVDAEGKIRWQDISYEPFMDPDFVLEEADRLLKMDPSVATPAASLTQR